MPPFPKLVPGQVQPALVADELAIRRVLAANEQAITDNDVETYTNTFAPDAHVKWWDREVTGRAAVGDYFREQQGKEVLRDVLVNLVVQIAGDEATTTGSALVIRAGKSPAQLLATATVLSTLRRTDSVWLIQQQEKRADPSFDVKLGALSDVVERLTKRVEELEKGR